MISPRAMTGTLELLPREQVAFQRMLDSIRRSYESFGFLPLETPVMEYVDVLLTKSGGETEKQIYFVQSTGNRAAGKEPDLALRFDLTVPTARYVAAHEGELNFPFRRYQIQRVYRGERTARGRFREFYQCDIDVIGKDQLELAYDAEIPVVIDRTFRELEIGPFTIHLNHRKVLLGMLAELGVEDKEQQTLVVRELDKLDRRGRDEVHATLAAERFSLGEAGARQLLDWTSLGGHGMEVLEQLSSSGPTHPLFREGLEELQQIGAALVAEIPAESWGINLAIARGLDYYTGVVFETTLDDHPEVGSICSGGRYDNLAGHYTRSRLPGVGISIGATRLFSQLRELGLLKEGRGTVQVLVTQLAPGLNPEYARLAAALRGGGLSTERYLAGGRMKKQLKYADRAGIPLVVIFGEDEARSGQVVIKDLRHSRQREVPVDDLVTTARALLEDPP